MRSGAVLLGRARKIDDWLVEIAPSVHDFAKNITGRELKHGREKLPFTDRDARTSIGTLVRPSEKLRTAMQRACR